MPDGQSYTFTFGNPGQIQPEGDVHVKLATCQWINLIILPSRELWPSRSSVH